MKKILHEKQTCQHCFYIVPPWCVAGCLHLAITLDKRPAGWLCHSPAIHPVLYYYYPVYQPDLENLQSHSVHLELKESCLGL